MRGEAAPPPRPSPDRLGCNTIQAQQIYERDRRHLAVRVLNLRTRRTRSFLHLHIRRIGVDALRERLDQKLRVRRGQNPERGRLLSTGIRKKGRGDQSIAVTRRPVGPGASAIWHTRRRSNSEHAAGVLFDALLAAFGE